MADELYKVLPDKVRYLEARVARLEDKVETYEHRRTTWVPSASWENLSGRQREFAYFLLFALLMWTTKRLAHVPSAS